MARGLSIVRHGLGFDARRERGAVYVEFIIAFVPLFLFFLGICQAALMHTAKLVVQHAAFAAVRSAVVVLPEPPKDYDNASRGDLTWGSTRGQPGLDDLLARFGVLPPWWMQLHRASDTSASFNLGNILNGVIPSRPQQGARMVPIRAAAYMPLMVLAPLSGTGTLSGSVALMTNVFAPAALEYTKAASVVTIQVAPGSDDLARDPVDSKAPVTVHVTYLYECGVPLVNALMCDTLRSLLGAQKTVSFLGVVVKAAPTKLGKRLQLAESDDLESIVQADARFVALDAEATLPNQGAAYEKDSG